MIAHPPPRGARARIIEGQRHWATRSGIEINNQLRTLRLADNLFQPLHPRTRGEFEAGAGDELGTPYAPGKLASVHSSAALACNVFDFWRDRDTEPLLAALGVAHDKSCRSKRRIGLGCVARPHTSTLS